MRSERNGDPLTGDAARRLVRRTSAALVAAAALFATILAVPAAAAGGTPGPYFLAPFTTRTNGFTFGQDPSWTPDGRVLSTEKDPAGVAQVFVSALDGAHPSCLTCGQPGPNGFAQERPQGDWILFCSWRGQTVTFGAPCLGGVGTDLYAMRPDGTHVTRLTAPGFATEAAGTPWDNYHPYWSPDGRQIAWTHLDFLDGQHGGTQWTILVADFRVDGSGAPSLADATTVAPGGDTAYETQPWAPDGSGVLYTAFASNGDARAGWLNTELYFLRLHGHGASLARPQPLHLTDDHPGWDEQAVFTPDMRDVVWMSSRATPTWYQTVVTAAQQTGYRPSLENETAGPMFVLSILDPRFRTDLYELDLATHAVRRLTDANEVVPEFYFDPGGTRLLWTNGEHSRTTVGTFRLRSSPEHVGHPPTVAARWKGAPLHGDRTPPQTVRPTPIAANGASLPTSVTESLALLDQQLGTLTQRLQGLPQGAGCCRTP